MFRFNLNKKVSGIGEIASALTKDEVNVRVIVEHASAGNTIVVSGRVIGQSNWVPLATLIGSTNQVINIESYDSVKVECTSYSSINSFIKVLACSFNVR